MENRARLLLEIVDSVVEVWGSGRVGVHLSPRSDMHDVGDSNPLATFGYVARKLGERDIAFICARESAGDDQIGPELKRLFGGVYIGNEGYSSHSGAEAVSKGEFDAIAFGVLYIANPDLESRIELGVPLNEPDPSTFYGGSVEGYTDLPRYEAALVK